MRGRCDWTNNLSATHRLEAHFVVNELFIKCTVGSQSALEVSVNKVFITRSVKKPPYKTATN